MRAVLVAALLAFPLPVLAQDSPAPQTVEVRLSNFEFEPRAIALTAGRPVVLRLTNTGGGGHNFSAPQFFAAASGVTGPVVEGEVEVPGHQSVEVRLTPSRGSYRLRCTHTMHTAFGMRGTISVE
ncbi:MAG TPA: cupredoxin domain-containing protein [Allosphingosinicella sp.]|nr:cupredoxin domain-containing protein [Allosphingosinicella sp.]